MNTLPVTPAILPVAKTTPQGFSVSAHPNNVRLQNIVLSAECADQFLAEMTDISVQHLEYKPFMRFKVADILNQICHNSLGNVLLGILRDRATGAFLLNHQVATVNNLSEAERADFNVKLATAISHLVGLPNFDSMAGKYYARFTVKNEDNSDSYLRQAHRRMEMHNDGTYVNERTDFVLMQKMLEENMQGGDSLLLHLDDWTDLDTFYQHPQAKVDVSWTSPPSKKVDYKVKHPVFFEDDTDGKPHLLFIDQFAEPANIQQGVYLYELGESLESANLTNVPVPVGAMLVIHNHRWLHGRDKFVANPGLKRELLRQRGHFVG